MRLWPLAAGLIAAIAPIPPAGAQQALSPPPSWLPHPTDGGKPIIYDPQYVAKGESDRLYGCSPGLQCRVRILGVIQNNGAVELRVTPFTW